MKVTISFGSPLPAMLYTASVLALGWCVDNFYGRTPTSAWILFCATILLFLRDTCIAVLFGIAVAKIASSGKKHEHNIAHTAAESFQPSQQEPRSASAASRNLHVSNASQNRRTPQQWLDFCIEDLEFSVRTQNSLKNANIEIVSELVQCSVGDLIDVGLSPEAIYEVKETLDAIGLELRLGIAPYQEEDE